MCEHYSARKRVIGYSLSVRLDHDVAVDEDGAYDGEGEERVGEDVDGDPPDGVEGREQVERGLGGEAEDGAAARDDDERLLVLEVGVDVADGRAGELHGELPEAARQVVARLQLGVRLQLLVVVRVGVLLVQLAGAGRVAKLLRGGKKG